MKHLLTKLMLMIAPTVMMAKTPSTYPSASASFNIKALDQQITYSHYYYTPQRITAEIEGVSNCTTNNLMFYNVEIDLNNDGTIDMLASSEVDHDYLTWTKDSLDGKVKCFIAPNSIGNFTFTLPSFPFDYTPKSHKFYWHIYDECGQESKTTSLAYTVDKKAPTPYCVTMSTLSITREGMEIFAKDFNKGAFDNFTPEEKLIFTFEGVYPIKELINKEHYYKKGNNGSIKSSKAQFLKGLAYKWIPSKWSSSMILFDAQNLMLNINVWDEVGNTDYCTIMLNNTIVLCNFPMVIEGMVKNADFVAINDAKIILHTDKPGYPRDQNSNMNGEYYFGSNPGGFYSISGEYSLVDKFNVNQKDIRRLDKHLSGQKPFTSYWQFIAADINNDTQVDYLDLKLLDSLITNGVIPRWEVIETNANLNAVSWVNFKKTIEGYFDYYGYHKVDFTAILIGDIDGSSAGLDVIQYDSNNEIKSDENDISYKGQDLSNKGASSFEIIPQDQIFAAHPSPNDPKCTASVQLSAEIKGLSNCVSNNLIYYHVDIDLDSDGTIDMIASSKVNQNFATWTLDTTDQKMKCFMAPNAKGNFSFELPQFIQLNSIKTHKVSWHIYDECGQSSKTSSTFQVKDKKAPTPYCVSINTALMQTNPETVELFAKDYDKGAFDNCSSQNNLAFTFDQLYPVNEHLNEEHYYKKGIDGSIIATHDEFLIGEAYRWIPSMKSCGKIFKCKDFLENNVNMSVWDEAGNTDYCTLRFINFEGCDQWESRINILGKVHSLNNKPIKEATVTFDANLVEYPKSVCTQNGLYSSQHIKGNDYAVSATYPKKDLHNVNPKDVTRLERHLNGLKPFTNYWQYIAADVNFDKKVDIEDLKHLEKILPTNESIWLFIQKVDSINTLNWYNYKYYVELKNQQTDVDVDFTAILIGDIDGSSAGLDVIQYDSNNEIKSDENDISYEGQDLSNKGASSFEIIPQDQIFAAHPSPNDPKCTASVQLEAEIKGISNCVSNNLIYYHVEIDLDSDSTVNMIASSHVDKSFTSWTYDEVDKIQKLYVAPDAKGNYIMKLPAFALESKLIRHSVTWKISDECGNVSMQEVTMFCIDKKAPTPYCVSISTVMQSNPYIFEAVAIDYNKGAFDNCTPEDKLIFTFEGIYPLRELINEEHYYKKSGWTSVSATKEEYLKGMAYKWIPDKRSSSFIFTSCGDFVVNISVWDEAGNTDYCTIELRVLCVCTLGSVKIHGKVQSVSEKMIKEATIYIDGNALEYPKIYQTQDGSYSSYHPTILKYFVSGYYKTKQTFYVNQKDILRLEAHINGRDSFSHYWQYIAADVNQDKIVDQKDLEILQNKILAKDSTVWTLINKVDSLNTLNWHKYNTIVTVNGQNLDAKVDFTAILIGDIDGSSAGLDVVQYDSNHQLEDSNETTWRGTLSSNIEDLKAYPNPYADQFTIEFSNTQDEVVKLTLMDISGKVTHSMELQSFKGKNTFLIQDSFLLTSGIKLIRLESVSGVRHLKVLKTIGHH